MNVKMNDDAQLRMGETLIILITIERI